MHGIGAVEPVQSGRRVVAAYGVVGRFDDVVVLVYILCVSQAKNLGLLWELPGSLFVCTKRIAHI
jgi:hypothetical protein